jgi:hypothetical protein
VLFLLPAGEEVVVLSSVAAEAALEMGKAVRSSLLLADLVGVGAGAGAGAGSARRRFWSGVCCERLVSLGTAVWGLVLMGLWALEERLEEGD